MNNNKNALRAIARALPALIGVVTIFNGVTHADDQGEFGVGIGADHTVGKYGSSQTTRTWTAPLKTSYETDNYAIELTAPYVHQTGPAGSLAGRRARRQQQATPVVTQSGLGDTDLSGTWYLTQGDSSGVAFDIGAIVKFDTGDVHQGLGTGANDYSLQADLSKRFGKISLTGTVGYSWLGSAGNVQVNGIQENLQFKNAAYGSLGSSYKLNTKTKFGLSYSQKQAVESGGFPDKELTLYTSIKTSSDTRLRLYILKGFSDGSPDHGAGMSFNASF